MMFEVQDLAVASPATVSRCGMVYLEPSILGLMPFVECWLKRLPALLRPFEEQFKSLFISFLEVREATVASPDGGSRVLWPASTGVGCLSSAGVPRFRPVLGEGSDHLNQQQPDHESPQAAGLLLQALPAQRSETLSGGLQPAHSCPACLSRGPRIPSSASCKRESDWLTWFMHGTPPSGLLQRLRDDPCPHPLGFLRPLSSAPASVLRASRRYRPRS